ncbi:MAG: PilZ domain-containing protein [Planctomycetota bacterium]
MSKNQAVTFRRHARDSVRLTGTFQIGTSHRVQVRIADLGGAASEEPISISVVDVSTSGFGWESPVFLPRQCRGTISVYLDDQSEPFEHEVEVRRVRMQPDGGRYAIGASLVDASEESTRRVLEFLKQRGAENAREGGGAAA